MSKYTAFRCPIELLRKARMFAEGERRTLSNYIIRLMEEDAIRRAARQMELHEQKETAKYLHGASHSARA
jgi:hypothetical protein